MPAKMKTLDANEAAAHVALRVNDLCIIYPITPSSPMGEFADQWASEGQANIWGTVPDVIEMQSEAGAAGAVHGALQTGSMVTTFTASQGLLLMMPNMFKIAGELTPAVFHVSARTVATHALSIFGDHSDVMAVRSTGFGMMAAASVQQVMDLALISQAASLESRVPLVHFFDGFRTSHEVNKISILSDDDIRAMIDDELVFAHRGRGMTPDRPVIRGTAQNPDVFFQAREGINPFYAAMPDIVEQCMARFAKITGRQYGLFEYTGAPDAERVVVLMGSGAETASETVRCLADQGEKVGALEVHLYRPFSVRHFLAALPASVQKIAVLDRTKEPGAVGEPLYQDVVTALAEAQMQGDSPLAALPLVVGGRYGLSSKDFTPAMVKGVLDELSQGLPKNHFTVGINDDVSHSSVDYDPGFDIEADSVTRGMFFGLGSDGTVGANKNSIKIIGEGTDNNAQGYFVYDSKKSGSQTVSHLRFGPGPIRAPYLIQAANFIGCHQFGFLEKTDVLANAIKGGVFLLNCPYGPDDVWDNLPLEVQQQIIDKELQFYVIDAYSVARDTGMGAHINTIMQTCFFAISGVLPEDEAIAKIKDAIRKTFSRKGEEVVQKNFNAVDQSLAHLNKIDVPGQATSTLESPPPVPAAAPEFVRQVTGEIMAGRGDELPVSAFPVDGTFPTGTTAWEKRSISLTVPVWDAEVCVQCGNCALVCPHGVIRAKSFDKACLAGAPDDFPAAALRGRDAGPDEMFTLQISPDDCTGCTLCVKTCPAKNKQQTGLKAINMADKLPILERERENWEFSETLPTPDRTKIDLSRVRGLQYAQPLFEFSGACPACGETPYVKLLSQLFGDRAIIANATGCSSIYCGNLPTTPWTTNADGRGPTWSNSLFEDNAEFGFGFRATIDRQEAYARELLGELREQIGGELVGRLLDTSQDDEAGIAAQRANVAALKDKLATLNGDARGKHLLAVADHLVKRSVWILGGDGWAYDIGYGGLDHVVASGRNVNILVLDTEVYSNTGGQMSKATPRAAVAKFAAGGKQSAKKDLGMMAMCYGSVYVAKVALGAKPAQTLKAFVEAEAYDGPSLIIAYSHCIAHGINMADGFEQQKLAVDCGHWPLFRYHPDRAANGENPLQLDSADPSIPVKEYAYNEVRYRMLTASKPDEAKRLMELGQADVEQRWQMYKDWARND